MVVVASINGSPHKPSRTQYLLAELCAAMGESIAMELRQIELCEVGPDLFSAPQRSGLSVKGDHILRQVESAEILVVGTPVYHASYTGLLKQLFDLLDDERMRGRIAVPVANGETPMHGLMLEHQMRPLFSSIGIVTTSTTLFATQHEISDGGVLSRRLREAAQLTAIEAVQMYTMRSCMGLESFSPRNSANRGADDRMNAAEASRKQISRILP
ncbi:NAD(P)H-dependent oxidoreductase [Paracoccus sp. (in: a-proteobacteria)]|uniref:NAD(P)H-dependent oxidoreductase n=1 Tax=Paracoccus sp. TaxID=267 RepID=UPI00289ACB0A|nr:NAD(P)H-dependent oxidoreductase [Paracoccus sp. (in: a-proteobacteria)]